MRTLFSLFGAALMLSACAQNAQQPSPLPAWTTTLSANHPLIGRIWNPATKAFLKPEDVIKHAAKSDFTLLGENHDNPDHHRLQAWVIRELAKTGRRPTIVLEMIEETRQDALDAYQNNPDATAAGLGDAVDWDKSGWPAWRDYQPIADAAFATNTPIVAGSPVKPAREKINRGKANRPKIITEARRTALGVDRPLAPWRLNLLLETIDAGHCGLVPKAHLSPMVRIQRVRDAVLADNLNKASERRPENGALLIAGANHARTDFAVPVVLKQLAPNANVLTLAFIEVSDDHAAPEDYAQSFNAETAPFDYLWFTPRANDTDYCAELKDQFSSHKK